MTTKKAKAGEWMPLDSACVGNDRTPVRKGQPYSWDHPAVQLAPDLFVPADLTREEFDRAVEAYHNLALDNAMVKATAMDGMTSSGVRVSVPQVLRPGPGVVRCVRFLAVDLAEPTASAMHVYRGELAPSDSWFVKRWPDHFEPSTNLNDQVTPGGTDRRPRPNS